MACAERAGGGRNMRLRLLALLGLALAPGAFAQVTDIPRTAEGRPDFQGVWESRWLTPLERPDGTDAPIVTGDAAVAFEAKLRAKLHEGDGALHPEEDYDFTGLLPAADGAFRTSLIIAPANGKRPQSQIARDVGAANRDTRKRMEGPEFLSADERCIGSAGFAPLTVTPGSMFRQIVQTPAHLMIYTEEHMITRIVGINAAPRPEGLVSLAGDSVATWDGDTLVVATTQIRPQLAAPGAPAFEQQRRVTERFSLTAPNRISYEYLLEDDAMLTEPMRVEYALIRTDQSMHEAACHEGNYSIPGMMLGARLEEAAASRAKP